MEKMETDLGFELGHAQFASPWSATGPRTSVAAPLGRWLVLGVIATGIWSLVEAPFEVWGVPWGAEVAACLLSKVLWIGLIALVLLRNRTALLVYGFLSALSVVAVGFSLPAELRIFPLGFALSLGECVLKTVALSALLRRALRNR
ncbi:hypothetical protein [Paraburkholderia sp. BCC1884]|uniref:hypothetical protein n=1 Tax=Paraburkholderia sp. BCC1884 TaxID=2562668 RepID=UPI001182B75D|nr:hypothetical protein [Paraburkholderia sp. BCC1884]